MDFIVVILVLFLGFLFINSFKSKISAYESKILTYLYFYHIFFGLYNYFFIGSDPVRYWKLSKEISFDEFLMYLTDKSGTYFMLALDYFPANVMGLSYFTGTIIYTVIGFMGIAYFYLLTIKLVPYNSVYGGYKLFPLVFFFPNLHFWSCTAGKDTLSFFCVAIFCYGLLQPLRRIHFIIIAILVSYSIRPHIALFLVVAFGVANVLSRKTSVFQRFSFALFFIVIGFVMLPTVMEYSKIEEASLESFDNFSSQKAALLSRSTVGSRIDISSYPLPLKLFTFLYRPLFFDINGFPAFLASIENLFLLFLSIKVFKSKPVEAFRNAPMLIKGLLLFLFIGAFAFSNTLGNLGIIIRMRNMFLPGLLIFILWCFSYQKEKKMKLNQ